MPRYKLVIEYLGSAYSGWQKQLNAVTVEETIESALERITGESIDIIGQGRTDSGVHAEAQTAHVDFLKPIDKEELIYALVGVLPKDIAVWDMERVSSDFHARFDAIYRRYRYCIARRPRPLLKDTSATEFRELDTEAMNYCADLIEGTHNFDSFTKPDNQNPSSECEVSDSTLTESDGLLIYRIQANRFVRHMVRRLVGTMLQVGLGKRLAEDFKDMLLNPSKLKNGHGAPARGLILEKVGYKKV